MPLTNASGSTMSFVAHIDDDLLFQNPDIQESISSGGGHTTVYLTAGDAGRDSAHWIAREAGAKAAYGEMAGANDWVDAVATFGNSENRVEIQTSYLESQPEVRLYFLRLPDGNPRGTGYDITGEQSLEQLWESEIETVTSVDGENTLTADQLSGILVGLMNQHMPDEILIQDHSSEYVETNHSDHVVASQFVYDAQQYYGSEHEVHSYLEYATSSLPENQSPEEAQETLEAYYAYTRGYTGETDPDITPAIPDNYLAWTSRHYHVDNLNDPDNGTVKIPDFAVLDFISEAPLAMRKDVVPCFTPGTLIATSQGERMVEDLVAGDRVVTRDHGFQKILWIGRRNISKDELAAKKHLRPIVIRRGALGQQLPERDLIVSPQHRVLVRNPNATLYLDESEVLAAAKHLTNIDGIDVIESSDTIYIHLLFEQHELVLSDGIWTESFQPGELSMLGFSKASRREIFELFPTLATPTGIDLFPATRRHLKNYEALVVTT